MPATQDNPRLFETGLAYGAVTAKGLSDVSILTGGQEAGGHGFFLDEKSIDQLMGLCLGKSLPAYLTHEDVTKDRLGQEIGMFSGFYRDGLQLRAKNFTFTDAFMRHSPAEYETIAQLAAQFPDQLGISPVIRYAKAWVTDDGNEMDADENERPYNALRELPSARIASIKSADFVKKAAANVALFSKKDQPIDKPDTNMADTISLKDHTAALAAKDSEVTGFKDKHTAALAEIATLKTAHETALAAKETEKTAALAAQQIKLKTEHDAALAIVNAALAEAKTFDMRLAGAPALEVALQKQASGLPEVALTDAGKWDQHTALEEADKKNGTKLAPLFKAKHLSKSTVK